MKKTSFSDWEFLQQEVPEEDIRIKDGGKYIPIGALENALDQYPWGTQNFTWQLYKDGYGKLCVAASLELLLPFVDDEGNDRVRTFVGACNFPLWSLGVPDWLATAKSQCVKNAASDAGRRLGRGLNDEVIPDRPTAVEQEKAKQKFQPDDKIRKQFATAVERRDQKTIAMLENIYEFKTEENGNETF